VRQALGAKEGWQVEIADIDGNGQTKSSPSAPLASGSHCRRETAVSAHRFRSPPTPEAGAVLALSTSSPTKGGNLDIIAFGV